MRNIGRPPNDSLMRNNHLNEPRGTCVPWVWTHRKSNLWQIDKPIMVCHSITFITNRRWTCWGRPLTSSGSGGECCVKDGGEEWHRMRLNSRAHKLLRITTSSALHTVFTHRYSALCEDALRTFQPAHAALLRPCAVVHSPPGLQSCGCCPQPFTPPGLQLGKPAEIHPPSDNFRLKQLLLGDQCEWTCAQNYKPGVLQWVLFKDSASKIKVKLYQSVQWWLNKTTFFISNNALYISTF